MTKVIVADTGNNRLQIFHVDELPSAPEAPGVASTTTGSSRNGISVSCGASLDGTIDSWQSSTGSLVAWALSQTPAVHSKTEETNREDEDVAEKKLTPGRWPQKREQQKKSVVPMDSAPPIDVEASNQTCGCLLVFNGGENATNKRKRRVAGESQAGEGPLRQPCDLSYWKARGGDDLWAWTPQVPPWFRFYDGYSGNNSGSAGDDAALLREELLSLCPALVGSNPTRKSSVVMSLGDIKHSMQAPRVQQQHGDVMEGKQDDSIGDDIGNANAGGRGPQAGTFVVRETSVPGELQLLFVAKKVLRQAGDGGLGKNCCTDLDVIKFASRVKQNEMSATG